MHHATTALIRVSTPLHVEWKESRTRAFMLRIWNHHSSNAVDILQYCSLDVTVAGNKTTVLSFTSGSNNNVFLRMVHTESLSHQSHIQVLYSPLSTAMTALNCAARSSFQLKVTSHRLFAKAFRSTSSILVCKRRARPKLW